MTGDEQFRSFFEMSDTHSRITRGGNALTDETQTKHGYGKDLSAIRLHDVLLCLIRVSSVARITRGQRSDRAASLSPTPWNHLSDPGFGGFASDEDPEDPPAELDPDPVFGSPGIIIHPVKASTT